MSKAKLFALSLAVGSLSTGAALAQAHQNYDPAALRAAQSFSTPEKVSNMIRENFHVNLSKSWPTNFPLPAYTSNVLKTSFSNSTKGPPTAAAILITKDQPKQVFDFYQTACIQAKWKVKVPTAKMLAEMSKNGEIYLLTADQGKQSIFLTCTKNKASNGTLVSINWQKNP